MKRSSELKNLQHSLDPLDRLTADLMLIRARKLGIKNPVELQDSALERAKVLTDLHPNDLESCCKTPPKIEVQKSLSKSK